MKTTQFLIISKLLFNIIGLLIIIQLSPNMCKAQVWSEWQVMHSFPKYGEILYRYTFAVCPDGYHSGKVSPGQIQIKHTFISKAYLSFNQWEGIRCNCDISNNKLYTGEANPNSGLPPNTIFTINHSAREIMQIWLLAGNFCSGNNLIVLKNRNGNRFSNDFYIDEQPFTNTNVCGGNNLIQSSENAIMNKEDILTEKEIEEKAQQDAEELIQSLKNIGNVINGIGNLISDIKENKDKRRDEKAETFFNLGIELYKQGDLDGAISAYQRAIQLNPQEASTYLNLGITLKAKGDLDGTITAYKKAIEIDPNYAKAFYNLGIVLINKGDLDGAIIAYKKAIEIDPNYAESYYNLGNVFKNKEDLDGAITAYKKAIEINPNHAKAYNNLGIVLKNKGDLDGAVTAFKKAIKIHPKHAFAYSNLSSVYLTMGLLNESKIEVQKSIEIDSTNSYAYKNLGHVYLAEKNKEKALQLYSCSHRLFDDPNEFIKIMKSDYKEFRLSQYYIDEVYFFNIITETQEAK